MSSCTRPADIRTRLQKCWDRGDVLRAALADLPEVRAARVDSSVDAEGHGQNINLPYRVPLRGPSRREMVDHFDELREWIEQIRNAAKRAGLELEWKEVNHRQLGRNEIPAALLVPDPEQFARYLKTRETLDRFREYAGYVAARLPDVTDWIRAKPFTVLELEGRLERLIRFVEWVRTNPPNGMYLRQVDLPGIDTKFLEAHTGVLSAWLDRVLPEGRIDRRFGAGRSFEKRYGFGRKPEL
ncbi:MAG: DUF3322 domain-containing protein, partial [Spirochaetia bacterium]